MEGLITVKNVKKVFKDREGLLVALKDINLDINDGEFFTFVGPSGSGKSTLLRIMSGLEKEYDGEVLLQKGVSKTNFNFVFQQFALLPWLTVFENVELGLLRKSMTPPEERRRAVSEQIQRFGLEKFADSHPRVLSGGMRQRVGIARALATNPRVLFLDEPFSELDSFIADELRKELLNIWQERKLTIVMVSHIISESLELSDKIAVLTERPGTIKKVLVNNLLRPRQSRTDDFYKAEDEIKSLIKISR